MHTPLAAYPGYHVVSGWMEDTHDRDDLVLDLGPERNELQIEGEV